MPRRPRNAPGGFVYHVLHRAVARQALFQKDGDYQAFERVVVEALAKHPMRVLAYGVMPNHWHFVLWPEKDGASQWQQQTARTMGLEATLRPLGRPKKHKPLAAQEQGN